MKTTILIAAVLLSGSVCAQTNQGRRPAPKPDGEMVGRYQIVITRPTGMQSLGAVFRVDTITGEVSYCYPDQAATPGGGAVLKGVVCLREP